MSIEEEIRNRLNNEANDFPTNLAYGVKIWKSSNFYYMSKYEIITEYFSDNLLEFYKSIRKLEDIEFEAKWKVVNEFLLLECPLTALSKSQHTNITNAIKMVGSKGSKRTKRVILESFLIVSTNSKYKNFYKYDLNSYGEILRECLIYLKSYMKSGDGDADGTTIRKIFSDINLYVKANANSAEFKETFYKNILVNLTEVSIMSTTQNLNCHDDLLALLKELYFIEGGSAKFYRFAEAKSHLLMGHFDISSLPIHVQAVIIEGYLAAYKNQKADILNLTKYIFNKIFVDVEKSLLADIHDIFSLTTYYFYILKKYFVKFEQILLKEYDFTILISMKLGEMFEKYSSSEEVLCNIFRVICAINDYNPLILEKGIISLLIKFMFVKKNNLKTVEMYQTVVISTIDLHIKLNRRADFRKNLFSELTEYLEVNNMEKKLKELEASTCKRSFDTTEHSESQVKRLKLENGDVSPMEVEDDENFMQHLYHNDKKEITKKSANKSWNEWKEIKFAWPDHNGKLNEAMTIFVATERSNAIFNYWSSLRNYLEDTFENIEENQTESELFKLHLLSCFLCYLFSGNTMVEQSYIFWDRLQRDLNSFDGTLSKFGKLIVKLEDPKRIMTAFLNIVYSFGNFKMIVGYYRPETVEMVEATELHSYLSEDEWDLIEKKLDHESKMAWNRLRLQKIRFASLMNKNDKDDLVEQMEVDNFDEIKSSLLDRSTNYWFINLLSKEKKILISDHILANVDQIDDIQFILRNSIDDHEFNYCFAVSTYKNIAENLPNSILKKLSFKEVYEINEEGTLSKITKLIQKKLDLEKAVELDESDAKNVKRLLEVLGFVRLDELSEGSKNIVIGLSILLMCDVLKFEDAKLQQALNDVLMVQIRFGTCPNIFKYFDINLILRIFHDVDKNKAVLQCLFNQTIFFITPNVFKNLQDLVEMFKADSNYKLFKFILMSFEYLVKINTGKLKTITMEELSKLQGEYTDAIINFVRMQIPEKVLKKNKENLNEILHGFTFVIRYYRHKKIDFTDEIKEIYSKCLDLALKVSNVWSSIFLTCALNDAQLQLSKEKTVEIVENRWSEFKEIIKKQFEKGETIADELDEVKIMANTIQSDATKTMAVFVINNQDDKELEDRLKLLEEEAYADKSPANLKYILRIYATLSKRGFNKHNAGTSKIFMNSLQNIFDNLVQPLCIMKKFLEDMPCLFEILECFSVINQNQKINVPFNVLDNIVDFVTNINIKGYKIVDEEEATFFKLARLIIDILYNLAVNREVFVVKRLSQYMHVYNGVLAAIVCYKDDRDAQESIENHEILTLSELLHPLEKIMNFLAKQEDELRRVAPYQLASVIQQMISSKRSTALHQNIKQSINNICYELIAVCDKKYSPAYILRCSDEASKNVFTDMMKNYKKYRSFKGKI